MSDTNQNGETGFGRDGASGAKGPIIPKSANEALRPERVPDPPRRSRKARSQLVIFLNFLMTLVVFVSAAAVFAFYYAVSTYQAPGPLETNTNFIVRNGAEALREQIARGDARIVLRTRVARKITIAKRLHKLALELHVIDNGPGIPADIRDRIFYPLVSGREGGSGLGLTLAQSFVQRHDGLIECESRPGRTDFRILLPLG